MELSKTLRNLYEPVMDHIILKLLSFCRIFITCNPSFSYKLTGFLDSINDQHLKKYTLATN